jgi:hypothetical protein
MYKRSIKKIVTTTLLLDWEEEHTYGRCFKKIDNLDREQKSQS